MDSRGYCDLLIFKEKIMPIFTRPTVTTLQRVPSTLSSACGGSGSSGLTDLYNVVTSKRVRHDTEYHLKSLLGIPPLMMPYEYSSITYIQQPAIRPAGNTYTFQRACFGGISDGGLEASLLEYCQRESLREFYSNLQDRDVFNLGTSLAEAGKTVKLVVKTMSSFGRAMMALKKGKVDKAFDIIGINRRTSVGKLNFISNPRNVRIRTAGQHAKNLKYLMKRRQISAGQAWLEMTYGWTPLIHDVYNAAEYAGMLSRATFNDIYVKGSASDSGVYNNPEDISKNATNVTATCKVKWAVGLKIIDAKLRNLEALGLTNPLSLAWELTPFSFVLDWIYPIGAYLESVTAMQGYSINEKSRTTFRSSVLKRQNTASNTFVKLGHISSLEMRKVTLTRVTNINPTIVKPRLNIGKALGLRKFTTSLALARTRFR